MLLPLAQMKGQISSTAAGFRDSVAYLPPTTEKDPLFVFHQRHGGHNPGALTAVHPDGGEWNFEWRSYDTDLADFGAPFHSESGTSSSVSGLKEGGYQVRISKGTNPDLILRACVMLDGLEVWIEKDDEDRLISTYYTCDWLVLFGTAVPDTLIYYDLWTKDTISMLRDFSFKWTSDNSDLKIPNDTTILAPNRTYAPPYKDTWYILTVTDDLGMTEVDSVFYESIQTKAEFTTEYLDKVTGEWDAELTGNWEEERGSLDAPLTVRFINESLNGSEFIWTFLDTLGGLKETATTYDVDEMPEFTYYRANYIYNPSLLSISHKNCPDSTAIPEGIKVSEALLNIPNVFTPNGDTYNDKWVFKHQSIKSCRITVVDRTGKVVYKKKLEEIYSWDGWNGKMHESNRDAPEGQYYYVIEAMGYDDKEFRDATIWEQMKIFGGPGRDKTGTSGTGSGTGSGTDSETSTPQTLYTGWLYLYRSNSY